MTKIYLIKSLKNSLYFSGISWGDITEATVFDSKKEAEDIFYEYSFPTGLYTIEEAYEVDQEQIAEDKELHTLEAHIKFLSEAIKKGTRIQNGEGTNWVGYFKYTPNYENSIRDWFSWNDIDFSNLVKNKYYKVTGWDKSVENVSLEYIIGHIKEYSLDIRRKWLYKEFKNN